MNLDGYQRVYEQYFRLARKVANDVLNDYYLAGDVAQEVFLDAFMKKDWLDEKYVKYWVVLNTHRRAIDMYRRLCRMQETDVEAERIGELRCEFGNIPEAMVIRKEETEIRRTLLEMLREYNPDWYEFLMRAHVDGESYQNLARSYGIRESNLRVQICRARKWLSKMIRKLYGD